MLAFANIGSAALWLLFIWLLSAAGAAWLAERKGYTERVGLLFGLLLSVVGLVIVLLLPGRPGSTWKIEGPFPNPGARRPLGIPALGPVSAADPTDSLGPSIGDASSSSEPSSLGDAPSSSEPPSSEPPEPETPGGDASAD
jgi:hypothetical protein